MAPLNPRTPPIAAMTFSLLLLGCTANSDKLDTKQLDKASESEKAFQLIVDHREETRKQLAAMIAACRDAKNTDREPQLPPEGPSIHPEPVFGQNAANWNAAVLGVEEVDRLDKALRAELKLDAVLRNGGTGTVLTSMDGPNARLLLCARYLQQESDPGTLQLKDVERNLAAPRTIRYILLARREVLVHPLADAGTLRPGSATISARFIDVVAFRYLGGFSAQATNSNQVGFLFSKKLADQFEKGQNAAMDDLDSNLEKAFRQEFDGHFSRREITQMK